MMRSRKTSWLFLSRIHSGGSAFSIVAAAVECRANFPGTFYRLLLSVELSSASFTRMKWTLLFHLQCVFNIAFSYLIYLKIDFVTRKPYLWMSRFLRRVAVTSLRVFWFLTPILSAFCTIPNHTAGISNLLSGMLWTKLKPKFPI